MTDETVKAMARAILAVLHPEWDEDNCDTVERNKGPSWQRAVRCARAAEKARPVGERDALLAEAEAALGLGDTDRACHTIVRRLMDRLRSARPVGEVPEGWVMVPLEPTREMIFATGPNCNHHVIGRIIRDYRAMLSAAPSPPEGLGNKGFMADREVEKPTPVASDATPEGWLFVRDELHRMSLVIESAVREAEPEHHPLVLRLIKANTHLVRSAVPDGSLESQEKTPETSSVGDKQ